MRDWLPLRELAVRARPAGHSEASAQHARFRAQVAVWCARFRREAGMHWALHCDDVEMFAAALFGAWHAGKTVWLPGDALPQTRAALAEHVTGFAGDGAGDLRVVAGDAADGEALSALDEEATCLVVFTSGSSGEAMPIRKHLRQLAREVEALEATFGARLGSLPVHATVSQQHVYGLLFRVLWPLAAGRRIMPRRVLFHEDMFAALRRTPGILVSSPAHLRRLPDALDWNALRDCVNAVFSSGGALPEAAAGEVRVRLGCAPIEVYGSSETGGIAWREVVVGGEAWQALPGVAWRIEDDVLQVRSPHLVDMHWWPTEDRVAPHGANGFHLLGRHDRIVKVEEHRVSLTALERALVGTGLVQEARVVLLAGARNVPAAICVPSPAGRRRLLDEGKAALSRRLRAALASGHEAAAQPRRWRFVEALPVNAQGKTIEAALRLLFRPHRPEPHWLARTAREAELEFETTPDLLVFDGHFPVAPVLPGVAQVDWSVRWARQAFPLPQRLLRIEALKFQRIIGSEQRVRLSLQWHAERATLSFALRSQAGAHASGRIVFADDPA